MHEKNTYFASVIILLIFSLLIIGLAPSQRDEPFSGSALKTASRIINPPPSTHSIDGYWVLRAPTNWSSGDGISRVRRYADYYGGKADAGVIWKNNTLDDNGFLLQQEERHCGAWVQFYVDENISQASIQHIYGHIWADYTSQAPLRIAMSGNATCNDFEQYSSCEHPGTILGGYPESGHPELYNATRAAEYDLRIYNVSGINISFNSSAGVNNLTMHLRAQGIRILSFQNQKSFLIFNQINNTPLNDTQALSIQDYDGDKLSDWIELHTTFTDPFDQDTDDDGYTDNFEIINNMNPNDPFDWGILKKYNPTSPNMNISRTFINNSNVSIGFFDANATLTQPYSYNELNQLISYNLQSSNLLIYNIHATYQKYAFAQTNSKIKIDEPIEKIKDVTLMFAGGTTGCRPSDGYCNYSMSAVVENLENGDPIRIPGHKGASQIIHMPTTVDHDELNNYIDSEGNMYFKFATEYYIFVPYLVPTIKLDWIEVWVRTGEDELEISYPASQSPVNVREGDIIPANFTAIFDNTTIVDGLVIEELTIGTQACASIGSPKFVQIGQSPQEGLWQVNCTAPRMPPSTLYDLKLNVSDGHQKSISAIKQNVIRYM